MDWLTHLTENPISTAKILFLILAVVAAPGALILYARAWLRGKAAAATVDQYQRMRKELDAVHGTLIEYQNRERELNTVINQINSLLEQCEHERNELRDRHTDNKPTDEPL